MTRKNKNAMGVSAKDVDAYLAAVPADKRAALEKLRQAIRSAAPKAEESISYQIPTYKHHGPLVHFVGRKNYCSFIVTSKTLLEIFKNELKSYEISGTTIHFTAENPLPAALVKKIVKARIVENEKGQDGYNRGGKR